MFWHVSFHVNVSGCLGLCVSVRVLKNMFLFCCGSFLVASVLCF